MKTYISRTVKLGLLAMSLGFAQFVMTQPAMAQSASCISKNQKFGGATSACASEICTWEACKDRVIKSGGAPGRGAGGALKGSEDPGAWGTALAVCKPHEQIMNQCMKRNLPPPKPKTWCKTGSDADLDNIRAKANAMKARVLALQKSKKELRAEAVAIKDQYKAIKEIRDPERALYRAAKNHLSDTDTAYAEYRAKWITSGRLDRLNSKTRMMQENSKEFKIVWARYKAELAQYEKTRDDYKRIARDMLDRDRDCAAAVIALK